MFPPDPLLGRTWVAEGDGETASTPRPVARCSRRRQSALYIRIRVGAGGVRRLRGARRRRHRQRRLSALRRGLRRAPRGGRGAAGPRRGRPRCYRRTPRFRLSGDRMYRQGVVSTLTNVTRSSYVLPWHVPRPYPERPFLFKLFLNVFLLLFLL